jgi:hypothetical protein
VEGKTDDSAAMSDMTAGKCKKMKNMLGIKGPFCTFSNVVADESVEDVPFDWGGKSEAEGTPGLVKRFQSELRQDLQNGGFVLQNIRDNLLFYVTLQKEEGKFTLTGKTDAVIARAYAQCGADRDLISVAALIFEFKPKLYSPSGALVPGVQEEAIAELLALDKASQFSDPVVCLTDGACFRFYCLNRELNGETRILVVILGTWRLAIPYIRLLLKKHLVSCVSTVREEGNRAEAQNSPGSDSRSPSTDHGASGGEHGTRNSSMHHADIRADREKLLAALPEFYRDKLFFESHEEILEVFQQCCRREWAEQHPEWMGLTVIK